MLFRSLGVGGTPYPAKRIGTAVGGHALLDGDEIGPVVVYRLDRAATGVVCPECPGREFVYPSSECTAVAAAHVDPGLERRMSVPRCRDSTNDGVETTHGLRSITRAVLIKREPNIPCKVNHVGDGIIKSEVG